MIERQILLVAFVALVVLTLSVPVESVTFTSDTSITSGDYTYDGQDIVVEGCILTIDGEHQFNSMQITNSGIVTTAGSTLTFTVTEDLMVESDGKITVDSKGYSSNSGPGAPPGTCGGGGGYGGNGGRGEYYILFYPDLERYNQCSSMGGVSYGSMIEPADLGSGGGTTSQPYLLSQGGGAIFLDVIGTLYLDGLLTANGITGWRGGGGGSGGSIWLTVGTLSGNGSITANGADGDHFDWWQGGSFLHHRHGGGGGGGRVAIYYICDLFNGLTTVSGGTNGSLGTIYLEGTHSFKEADFKLYGQVDSRDFAVLGIAWGSKVGDANWNAICDISEIADGIIDWKDVKVFAEYWLENCGE